MVVVLTMIRLMVQYLLLPDVFLLTFVLPVVVHFIARRYIWFSLLLTAIIEVIVNWGDFTYYESRGLMIYFTAAQLVVMAAVILVLKLVDAGRKQ